MNIKFLFNVLYVNMMMMIAGFASNSSDLSTAINSIMCKSSLKATGSGSLQSVSPFSLISSPLEFIDIQAGQSIYLHRD